MSALLFGSEFEGHQIRIVGTPEAPEWVAKDVAKALGLKKIRTTLASFGEDEKGAHTVGTLGGSQQVLTLKEPGLYKLIFKSRRPEAERFQRWVFHEVLPAIRKTGRYVAPNAPDPNAPDPDAPSADVALDTARTELAPHRAKLELLPAVVEALTAAPGPRNAEFLALATRMVIAEALGLGREIVDEIHSAELQEDLWPAPVPKDLKPRLEQLEEAKAKLEAQAQKPGELSASEVARRFMWLSEAGKPHYRAVIAAARKAAFGKELMRGVMVQVSDTRYADRQVFTRLGVRAFERLHHELTGAINGAESFQVVTDTTTFVVYRKPRVEAAAKV